MKTLHVGLIGFGMAGELFHAPFIANTKGLTLSSIRTNNPDLIDKARTQYPDAKIVSESRELFEDKQIELVVVASPNQFHYELAYEALKAGKHVVIDKPFTVTSVEARQLIDLAEQKDCVLSVFQNRRWDSDFQTVKKIADSGQLGPLAAVEIHFDRFRNFLKEGWKESDAPGTGLLYDLGSHLIDQAIDLFGNPESVTADIRSLRPGSRITDYFDLRLEYANGPRVILKASILVKEPGPKYQLHGLNGSFVKYGQDTQETALNAGKRPATEESWGVEPEEIWGTLNLEDSRDKVPSEMGDYTNFYRLLYASIIDRTAPPVNPYDSLNNIRIIEQAFKSSLEKRTINLAL